MTDSTDSERAALAEWKDAVLGCCKACSGFDALHWGGDKDGWGFVMYFISHLNTRAVMAETALRASHGNAGEEAGNEALRLLAVEDERQAKLHELLETIREQIRLGVKPEHRPEGLFKNIQDAVYAMRGRTPLMNDIAITAALKTSEQ